MNILFVFFQLMTHNTIEMQMINLKTNYASE
jgi:hypothetical protein